MKVSHFVQTAALAGIALTSISCLPPESSVPASDKTTPTGVVVDSKGFAVDVCQTFTGSGTATDGSTSGTCEQGKFFIHKKGDRSQPCKISSASSWASADLECEVEAQELDLAFNGLKLAYNVPTTMCDYFWVYPYYFWNHEPGTAPSSLTYTVDRDTGKALTSAVTPPAAGSFDPNTLALSCTYDHSGEKPVGPNCCEGTTAVTMTQIDTANSKFEHFKFEIGNTRGESFTFGARASAGLDGKYFTFSTSTTNYYVWFNDAAGAAADPAPGGTGIEVAFNSASTTDGDLANRIVDALNAALSAELQASASASTVTVALKLVQNVTNAAAGTSGLPVSVTDGGASVDGKYLTFSTAVRNTGAITSIATDSMDQNYVAWFYDTTIGTATAPAVAGTKIQVNYDSSKDSAETIATATAAAISGTVGGEATVTATSNLVDIVLTRSFNVADATAGDTGFLMTKVNDGLAVSTSVPSEIESPGKYSNCLAGPGVDSQNKDEDGFPTVTIFDVAEKGKNSIYDISKSNSLLTRSTIYQSNFFTAGEHTGRLPAGLQPWDASPNLVPDRTQTPNPYYEFACLDRAEEVRARIRITVREWNSARLFVNYRDSAAGTVAAPAVNDLQSTAASNCDDYNPGGGITRVRYDQSSACADNDTYPINDYADWKDFLNSFPKLKF